MERAIARLRRAEMDPITVVTRNSYEAAELCNAWVQTYPRTGRAVHYSTWNGSRHGYATRWTARRRVLADGSPQVTVTHAGRVIGALRPRFDPEAHQ